MAWYHRIAANILGKQAGVDGGTLVGMINAGVRNTGRRRFDAQAVLEAYSTSPWFRAVVERVSFAAAVVPWRLFATKPAPGSGSRRRYVKHVALQSGGSLEVRDKIAKNLEANDQLEEITDHPLFDLLAEPNPILTGIDMRLITFASITVVGEIGWAITKGDNGEPIEIWPVPSHWIMRRPGESGATDYHVQINGSAFNFSTDEFVLFRNPTLTNPYGRGAGIGSTLADELETDEYISKFQSRWFVNHGKPDLVFIAKPGPTGTLVNEAELKIAKEDFNNKYRNPLTAEGSFWTRGDIDIKELGSKMIDLDLTEQRTWVKDLVHQVLGAPPEIMGVLTSSNRATITEALAILAIVTTVPQLERMRAQLQQQLIPMFDDRQALGYWSPVPEDREFQLKAMLAATHAPEVGEWRKIQGLRDRGDGDRVNLVPVNLIPVPAPRGGKAFGEIRSPELLNVTSRKLLTPKVNEIQTTTKATPGDVDVWLNALQPETLTAEVESLWSDEFKEWGEKTTAELGIDPAAFNMLNPFVQQHLIDFSTNRIKDINDTTLKALRETLLEGVREGEDIRKLAARTRDVFDVADRHRSVMIARTEVVRGANASTWTAYEQSGIVEFKQWVAAFINTRDTHAELSAGDPIPLGDPFISSSGAMGMHPGALGTAEEDINCFVPETEVRGSFLGGVRSMYSGPIVEIQTAGGRRLRVTPNHPVLTPLGFVAAGNLRSGDDVIGYGSDIECATERQDVDNAPTRIDQVFGAIGAPGFSARMRVNREDLHGDAAGVHGEVEVVAVDGALLPHRQPKTAQGGGDFSLMPTPSAPNAFVGGGEFSACLDRSLGSAYSVPSGRTLAIHSGRVSLDSLPIQPTRFGISSELDADLLESRPQATPGDAGLVADLLQRGAGKILIDQVAQVRDGNYCGHIYDLQSVTGWLVSDGLITSNCMCTITAVIGEPKSFEQRDALFKIFQAERRPWEKKAERAFRRGFANQEQDVLEALGA